MKKTEKQRKLLEVARSHPNVPLTKQAELAGYNPKSAHNAVKKGTAIHSELEVINAEIDENMRKSAKNAGIIIDKRLKHVEKDEGNQVVKQGDRALIKTTLDYHVKRTQPEEPMVNIQIADIRKYVLNVHNQLKSGESENGD